ncbi:MAG: YfhO family protein [Chloroflexia bacterium]
MTRVYQLCLQAVRQALRPIAPALVFLLLSAIFLWQPLLTGDVFLPTDLSYRYDYMWREKAGMLGVDVNQNSTLSDVSDYYFPYATYAIERLQTGHFPLWNPFILTGAPFFAAAQAAVLDPINLVTYLAGPYNYWTWGAFLRLALLGLGTYGFVRALGRSPMAGLAAGTLFMTCGFVTVWMNYSVVTTLVWMPALFWATTRLIKERLLVWVAVTAFLIGLVLLGGHPETQFLIGLTWGLFCLYSLFLVRKHNTTTMTRSIATIAVASILGTGLAAVQLAPFFELLLNSNAISQRASPVLPFDAGQTTLRLLVLLFPNFSGTPLLQAYWVPMFTNFNEQTGYIGLLAIALAVVGAIHWWRRDSYVLFFALIGIAALLFAIRAPGFHLVRALPVFNVGHGVRWVLSYSFFGAVLAGYGVEALLTARPRASGLRNTGLVMAGVALTGFAMLLVIYLVVRDVNWDRAWGPMISHEKMVSLFHPAQLTLYWPVIYLAAGAAVLIARWKGLVSSPVLGLLLVLLLYGDLWTFGSKYNPVTPRWTIYPPTSTINYIRANLGHERFTGTLPTLRPNVPMVFGLRDLRGYEDMIDSHFGHLYRRLDPAMDVSSQQDLRLTPEQYRLLQVASVRYVFTLRKPRVGTDASPFAWRAAEDKVALYENLQAVPRARVVLGANFARDIESAEQELLDPTNDPHDSVVLIGQGPNTPVQVLASGTSSVKWIKDEPELIEVEANLPVPGYLVLSDNYASGWEATVDGRSAPILRADVAFRAVALPPGRHTVAFYYRPPLFYAGALVSCTSIFAILLIAALHLLRALSKR